MIRAWVCTSLLLALAGQARAQAPTIAVTTDTFEYCQHLAGIVAQHRKPTLEVRRLAEEGNELCAQGAVRSGIARLRRALVLIRAQHHAAGAAPH